MATSNGELDLEETGVIEDIIENDNCLTSKVIAL